MSTPAAAHQSKLDGNELEPSEDLVSEDFDLHDLNAATRAHRTHFYTDFLLRSPFLIFLSLWAVAIVFAGLAFIHPIEIDLTLGAFVARNHISSRQLDAYTVARREFSVWAPELFSHNARKRQQPQSNEQPTGSVRRWTVSVVFEADVANRSTPLLERPNIVTRDNVPVFRAVERAIVGTRSFRQFCWTDVDLPAEVPCREPASLLAFMYPLDGVANGRGSVLIDDLDKALTGAIVEGVYQFTDKAFSATNLRSSIFRVEFHFGTPLVGFRSNVDRREEQAARFDDYLRELIAQLKNETGTLPALPSGVKMYFGGTELTTHQVLRAVEHDAYLAIGAVIFIFFFLWFQFGSLFMTIFGMLQVLISFPIAYFCYREVLQFEHVGVLNAIALFLIIGIGVDDVFVFFGVLRQCRVLVDPPARAAKTFRLASKSTFITSFTTAVAFATSIPSGIPALSLFGWYMTLLVAINWLMAVSTFFATLLVWDIYVREREQQVAAAIACCGGEAASALGARIRRAIHTPSQPEAVLAPAFSNGDRFFYVRWSAWLHRARYVLIVLGALVFGLSILAASTLRTAESVPNLFPAGSQIQNWLDYTVTNFFSTSSLSVGVKYGCDGVLNSGRVLDRCGVCGGRNECVGCDGVASRLTYDRCGVCGGNNECVGCDNVPYSGVLCSTFTTPPTFTLPTPSPTPKPTPTPKTLPTPSPTPKPTPFTPSPPTLEPTPQPTPVQCAALGQDCTRNTQCCSNRCAATSSGMLVCSAPLTPFPTPVRPLGCDGQPGGPPYDQCGVCNGNNACLGCDRVPFSGRVTDQCGVCGGDGRSCVGCDGVPFSNRFYDQCNVCGGDGRSCVGCDGVPFSGARLDRCGVCRGDNRSCIGCDGLYLGHVYDSCGVCNGDNNCYGCDGVYLSSERYDLCGVCGGANACIADRPRPSQVAIYVVFGIDDIDRSGRSAAAVAAGDIGDPVFDATFDFDKPAAQAAMVTLTERLESANPPLVIGQPNSFLAAFRSWVVDEQRLDFPLENGGTRLLCQFIAEKQGFVDEVVFNTSTIAVAQPAVGRKRAAAHCNAPDLKLIAARIRYSSYQLDAGTASFPAYSVYERWQELFDAYNADVGAAAGAKATHTSDKWVSAVTEVGTVRGVIYGVAVSSIVAFICLIVFTSNVLVSLLALFSQLASVFCTLAFYWLAGWSMGVIEAISITVLVGIALDYFFHIAEAYSVSSEYARRERVRDAFTRMGVNVLAGALTTGGAMVLILGADISIFATFGAIVVVNTLFAMIWVFVFFGAYLITIGPSGDFGNVKHMLLTATAPCRGALQKSKPARSAAAASLATPVSSGASEEPSSDGSERGRPATAADAASSDEEVVVGRPGKAPVNVAASDDDDNDNDDNDSEEPSSEMSFGDLKDRKK